ncbi:MAG: putative toxin-antitoxin system toxin component, PIN family, partial [Actinomycetota bacterium]|nr:putative toxin-antitoxin system toxin component, PIN family [Actinomycetota bacterium]
RGYVTLDEARKFVSQLHSRAELFDDPAEVPAVSRDPDDDYLVVLARSANVALVSGDQDLTRLELSDLHVLTPREFLDALEW